MERNESFVGNHRYSDGQTCEMKRRLTMRMRRMRWSCFILPFSTIQWATTVSQSLFRGQFYQQQKQHEQTSEPKSSTVHTSSSFDSDRDDFILTGGPNVSTSSPSIHDHATAISNTHASSHNDSKKTTTKTSITKQHNYYDGAHSWYTHDFQVHWTLLFVNK